MLKTIFYSLIPDNIKEIEIYRKVIDVFIDQLEEKCSVSVNVNNIFRMSDIEYKKYFIETYAKGFFEVLKTINTSNLVGAPEFDSDGNLSAYPAIPLDRMMTIEQIQSIRKFGENKGTKVGIEFVHNLIESCNTAKSNLKKVPFEMYNIDLFSYHVTGNITKESFEKYVKPLAHPVGFVYEYQQGPILEEKLKDTYHFRVDYNIASLTVNYGNNQTIYSYNDDLNFKVVDIIEESIDFVSTDFIGNDIIQNKELFRIVFNNGNYIEQITKFNEVSVIEYDAFGNIIKDYSKDYKNVYIDIEYIISDEKLIDSDLVGKLKFEPKKEKTYSFIDSNLLPIIGEQNLIIGGTLIPSTELNEDGDTVKLDYLRGKYLFTIGYGTTKYTEETLTTDEYINIRKYCKDDNLQFIITKK